ncbi:hypothetical protein FRC17_000230 [Serendipita sp. 399]|nr:hypothetical protein FRC17_000230 [Serendipita sp. 399]
MPKATSPQLPLNGIFAINKPSGPTSMALITRLKPMFSASRLFVSEEQLDKLKVSSKASKKPYPGPTQAGELTGKDRNKGKKKTERTNWKKLSRQYIKMGSGGTLDPLASGVLIIGVGNGTKNLNTPPVSLGPDSPPEIHGMRCFPGALTPLACAQAELIIEHYVSSRYSALKVDGRPLYEYARQNIPLPRPIESRKVTISSLELLALLPPSDHTFRFPSKKLDANQRLELQKISALVSEKELEGRATQPLSSDITIRDLVPIAPVSEANNPPLPSDSDLELNGAEIPPIFELEMTVSSGTYVRSVVHDLGIAVGSAAHVVELTRTQQGAFTLDEKDVGSAELEADASLGRGLPCVQWGILERALEKWEADDDIEVDEDGWTEWEAEILSKWPDQTKTMHPE